MKKLFVLLTTLMTLTTACAAIDLNEVESKLKTTGVTGEIHGSNTESSLFVLTVRDPKDFFTNIQLPLISENADIMSKLKSTKRHQFYTVKGEFADNKAPVKHINVTSLEMSKDYTSELDQNPYQYKYDVNDLKNKKEFIGRIHAIGNEGKMLVMEYGDQIVPVFVAEPTTADLVKTFYRGDLVRVRIAVRKNPDSPLHIGLVRSSTLQANEKPIELIESLVRSHGTQIEKTGVLVKFPKSPQIIFNIYALLVEDAEGTNIQYTLVNFEDQALFKALREKLETKWNENVGSEENFSNKLINRKIVVKAKGISNMVDQGQANPQILINSINDLEFVK
jgi:hypothetical protein